MCTTSHCNLKFVIILYEFEFIISNVSKKELTPSAHYATRAGHRYIKMYLDTRYFLKMYPDTDTRYNFQMYLDTDTRYSHVSIGTDTRYSHVSIDTDTRYLT